MYPHRCNKVVTALSLLAAARSFVSLIVSRLRKVCPRLDTTAWSIFSSLLDQWWFSWCVESLPVSKLEHSFRYFKSDIRTRFVRTTLPTHLTNVHLLSNSLFLFSFDFVGLLVDCFFSSFLIFQYFFRISNAHGCGEIHAFRIPIDRSELPNEVVFWAFALNIFLMSTCV